MLRVSTYNQFRTGEQNIVARQREVLTTQAQLSSGKRINGPADDPLGASDVASIGTSLSQFAQFKRNQDHANYMLNLAESALRGFVEGVQDVQEKLVAAGNGAYTDNDRRVLAEAMRGLRNDLLAVANRSDGAGRWLFGGLVGLMTVLIRVVNPAFPEGIMLAILFSNMFAPTIDYFVMQANIRRRMKRHA